MALKKSIFPLDSRCGSVETCRKASGGQRINTTFIYVTYDQTKAMNLGVCPEHIELGANGNPVTFNFAGYVCHVFNKETGINLEA